MAREKDKSGPKNDKSNPRSSSPSIGSMPSLSSVSNQPLDPETAIHVFVGVLMAALELKILDIFALLKQAGVHRLLESLRERVEERAKLVHETIGTRLNLALAQSKEPGSVDKQAADVVYALEVLKDDEVAQKLLLGYGLESLVRLVPLWELYQVIQQTSWMMRDDTPEREFAFRQCRLLVDNKIYESKTLVLEHIRNSIGNGPLVGDTVPAEKRMLILDSIQANMKSKAINTTLLGEIIFDAVPLELYAEYLPAITLGTPFADYARLLGVSEAPKAAVAVPPPLPKKDEAEPAAEDNGRERRLSDAPEVSVEHAKGDGEEVDLDGDVDALTSGG
ncbi:hypothetical protein IT087_04375 [Candidatus Uhrbacteria bacterium]|nr:hypothetical protein [Candidatus Uhrbacteria bacterium]